MNQLTRNFRSVIYTWMHNIAVDRMNRKIKRRGKALKEAIRQADLMHEASKKTYYVMPDYNGELRILDKANIKNLKKFKVMSKAVTVMDLLTESEYNTMNNHFLILKTWAWGGTRFEFFRGTILECEKKYNLQSTKECKVQILGGFEYIETIEDGKVTRH